MAESLAFLRSALRMDSAVKSLMILRSVVLRTYGLDFWFLTGCFVGFQDVTSLALVWLVPVSLLTSNKQALVEISHGTQSFVSVYD